LEIHYGQLIWIDRTGVWIDTICASQADPLLGRHTVTCGRVTRSEYFTAIRARLRQLSPMETIAQPSSGAVLPAGLNTVHRGPRH